MLELETGPDRSVEGGWVPSISGRRTRQPAGPGEQLPAPRPVTLRVAPAIGEVPGLDGEANGATATMAWQHDGGSKRGAGDRGRTDTNRGWRRRAATRADGRFRPGLAWLRGQAFMSRYGIR